MKHKQKQVLNSVNTQELQCCLLYSVLLFIIYAHRDLFKESQVNYYIKWLTEIIAKTRPLRTGSR